MEMRDVIIKTLQLFRANYRHGNQQIKIDQDTVQLWHMMLEGYTDEQIKKGCNKCLSEKPDGFFPSTGEFIKLLNLKSGYADERKQNEASWGQVLLSIASCGPYHSPVFKDGGIASAISGIGGWVALCQMDYNELADKRWEFMAVYVPEDEPRSCMGIMEQNRRLSHHAYDPKCLKLIGKWTELEKEMFEQTQKMNLDQITAEKQAHKELVKRLFVLNENSNLAEHPGGTKSHHKQTGQFDM
ncbi:MAG: hypothetical protein HQM11_07920 [SAR324 cluster bacterium]|nr:hypothetical protein [SAR324 cluster bacterium]